MDRLNNQAYYAARATTSRDLARQAADPMVAAIHNELAARYDLLATQPHQAIATKLTIVQAA